MSARQGVAVAPKQPATTARAVASSARREPTNDEIAVRAYEIFLRRGDAPGSDLEDWLQAERELQQKD